MKKEFLKYAALFIVAMCFATQSRVAAQANPEVPYIEVNATATRFVTPDEIYLRIVINENDYKGKKSLEEMQTRMLNVLKNNKINTDEDLTVLSMGSNVKVKIFSSKIKTRTAATYILKLADATTMTKVISDLEENEISNITLSETKYSKKKELESELGVEAIRQAKANAETLMAAIGQEAGKAIYVNSWNMSESSPRNYKMTAVYAAADAEVAVEEAATPTISIAEKQFSVTVSAKFEIK